MVVAAGVLGAAIAPSAAADILRVCADPDNLPFSHAQGPERGMYVELADLVGKRLNMPVEYVWWLSFYQRRALRNTLLAGECDAYFALPATAEYMGRTVERTKPFLDVGYALMARREVPLAKLADLKDKRIVIQFGSTPQLYFAAREGFKVTTVRTTDEALDLLVRGDAEVAMLWGPVAGYENLRRFKGAYRVVPVAGADLAGQVAVGVKKGNGALAAKIDAALAALGPEIAALADKYGFPRGTPVDLTVGTPAIVMAQAPQSEPADAREDGRQLFNNHCSHCHAPNAASPEPLRDLRRLRLRYGENWRKTTVATIKDGRPADGMPAWKDLLDDQRLGTIITFFESIQRKP